MSPTPPAPGPVRSAADVNADIRALIAGTGRQLSGDEKQQLERLYEEWAAAVRREMAKAA